MKSPGVKLFTVLLALSFASVLTPDAKAATDGKNLPECSAESKDTAIASEQSANGHRRVKAKILINASPHVVWETVHEERQHDPDLAYSKVLHSQENQAMLEQKFCLIPVIGTATCVMHNVEVPDQRIDYDMVSSDRFKAFEGSWIITPGVNATSTYLELSSYCDMGLPIPRSLVDNITAKKLQRRLANVKIMAEATQTRVAQNHKLN